MLARLAYLLRLYLHVPVPPDPVCHCGTDIKEHSGYGGCPGIPVNCNCGYTVPTRCPVHPKQYKLSKRAWDERITAERVKRERGEDNRIRRTIAKEYLAKMQLEIARKLRDYLESKRLWERFLREV